MKKSNLIILLVSFYVVVGMVSNIASCRMIDIHGWATDAGTLMFPLIFVLRDLIHKHSGSCVAKTAILACCIGNVFMFACFAIVAAAPPDMSVGAQTEFGQVLMPSGRIILGSIISLSIVELIDTVIYSRVAKRCGKGALAAASSNLVSIPLDSAVIAIIGFYGAVPFEAVVSIFITNVIVKFVMTGIFLPLTKKSKEQQCQKKTSC